MERRSLCLCLLLSVLYIVCIFSVDSSNSNSNSNVIPSPDSDVENIIHGLQRINQEEERRSLRTSQEEKLRRMFLCFVCYLSFFFVSFSLLRSMCELTCTHTTELPLSFSSSTIHFAQLFLLFHLLYAIVIICCI